MRLHTFQIMKSGPHSICTYCLRIMHYTLKCDACHCHSITDRANVLMSYFRLWQVDHGLICTLIFQLFGSWIICSLWVFLNCEFIAAVWKIQFSHNTVSDRKSWKASETQSSGMLSKVSLHQIATALCPLGQLFTAVMKNGGSQCLVCLQVAFTTKQGSSSSTNVIVQTKSWRLPWPSTAIL